MLDNLIRTKGREGRRGYTLPKLDVEKTELEAYCPKKRSGMRSRTCRRWTSRP